MTVSDSRAGMIVVQFYGATAAAAATDRANSRGGAPCLAVRSRHLVPPLQTRRAARKNAAKGCLGQPALPN